MTGTRASGEVGPNGVNVAVRAIVDPKGIGCSRHGDAAFGFCATCTLEMLDDLAKSSALPGLAHHARRTFLGLAALLNAQPDVRRFGTETIDHRDDVVRIDRRAHTHAAVSLALALARLETTLDYDGSLNAVRVDLTTAARDLGLNPDGLLRMGRDRLREAAPAPPEPPPAPEAPTEPERAPEPSTDHTAGLELEPPPPDPRARSIEQRRPSWWPGMRWGGRR